MRWFLPLILLCAPLAAKVDVLVSIPPLKFLVDELGGDLVEVQTLVPAGAGPHTYQPTARQVASATKAKIWVPIGEPWEGRIKNALKSSNPSLLIVDTQKNVPLIYWGNSADPHIWLSPRRMKIVATNIAEAMIEKMPKKRSVIMQNLGKLHAQLDHLDDQLNDILAPCNGEAILVSHAAFGYFCQDYDLVQLSIEFHGKEPTPQQLLRTIERARKEKVRTVIIDKQFRAKSAQLVAKELDLPACSVNPLAEAYVDNMLKLGRCVCQ